MFHGLFLLLTICGAIIGCFGLEFLQSRSWRSNVAELHTRGSRRCWDFATHPRGLGRGLEGARPISKPPGSANFGGSSSMESNMNHRMHAFIVGLRWFGSLQFCIQHAFRPHKLEPPLQCRFYRWMPNAKMAKMMSSTIRRRHSEGPQWSLVTAHTQLTSKPTNRI